MRARPPVALGYRANCLQGVVSHNCSETPQATQSQRRASHSRDTDDGEDIICENTNACGPVKTEQTYRHRGSGGYTAAETRRTRGLCTASHLCNWAKGGGLDSGGKADLCCPGPCHPAAPHKRTVACRRAVRPCASDAIALVWTGICADPSRMHPLEQELLKAVDARTASEGTLAFEQRTRDMCSEQSGLDAPLSATLDDLHHRVTEVRLLLRSPRT